MEKMYSRYASMDCAIVLIVLSCSGMSWAGPKELLDAAWRGDMQAVQENVEFVDYAQDIAGSTPLNLALGMGHESIARYLFEQAPSLVTKPSSHYNDPVLCAIKRKFYGFAVQLIAAGAWVNALTRGGSFGQEEHTPLFLAIMAEHEELVSALLHAGAHVFSRCGTDGQSSLHVATNKGLVSIMRLLLQHGADPEQCDSKGRTPLHVAIAKGRVEAVQFLIEAGALFDELPYLKIFCPENWFGNTLTYHCHAVIRYLLSLWSPGLHRYLESGVLIVVDEGEMQYIHPWAKTEQFQRYCSIPVLMAFKKKMALLGRELPTDLKKLLISFVAAQEDLDEALRFTQQDGQEEMVQFLRSIGATGASSTS